MTLQTLDIRLTLKPETKWFLDSEAAKAGTDFASLIGQILNDLSDPEQEETILIDQLLVSAASFFPPIMSLEEKEDFREEIIDYLVFRISELFQHCTGTSLSTSEQSNLLKRFSEQSPDAWGP